MNSEKESSFNFHNVPSWDDKDGWSKYADEVRNLAKQHAQMGETTYPTFGEKIAARPMQKYLERSASMPFYSSFEEPSEALTRVIKFRKKLVEAALDTVCEVNHEDIAELRVTLAELPVDARRTQNKIFTGLMYDYKSEFILKTIKPIQKVRRGEEMLARLFGGNYIWYDFIEKLTELDEDGKPVVSDELFQNFFEWYQTSLAKQQHELNEEMPSRIYEYSCGVEDAVKEGRLPEGFVRNLDSFEPDSPRSRNLNISLFDMMVGSSATGVFFEQLPTYRKAPIGVRADILGDYGEFETIWHELTHITSGDEIDFGDVEANQIINEALTEHISHVILKSDQDDLLSDEDDYAFMSGKAYAKEREVVRWLASSGNKTISPQMFYEAYAEYDPEYEKAYEASLYQIDGERPKPKMGPKKEALISALLEAFPECKDVNDLGKLIVKKFEEDK